MLVTYGFSLATQPLPNLPPEGEWIVLVEKKQWVTPTIEKISLAQAREKVLAALQIVEGHSELADECEKLRSVIDDLDKELSRTGS